MSNSSEVKVEKIPKSKQALISAMLVMLTKRSFQKISINDLCEVALVSRATFYVHFADKYHLLRCALQEERQRIKAQAGADEPHLIIHCMVEYIHEQPNLLKHLVFGETNQELQKMLMDIFTDTVHKELTCKEQEGQSFPVPLDVLAVYLAGGASHLLIWWIESGLALPKAQMTAYLAELVIAQATPCTAESGHFLSSAE